MLTVALIFLVVTMTTGVLLRRGPGGNDDTSLARKLGRRLLSTVAPVMVGATLGYVYATQTLSPELVLSSSMPALYASTGAIAALLATRLVSLLRFMMAKDKVDPPT